MSASVTEYRKVGFESRKEAEKQTHIVDKSAEVKILRIFGTRPATYEDEDAAILHARQEANATSRFLRWLSADCDGWEGGRGGVVRNSHVTSH